MAASWAGPQQSGAGPEGQGGEKTRLVQHFGPDAEDVEHMSERYVDEELPGAVQVPLSEDPRPKYPLLLSSNCKDLPVPC